MRLSLLALVLAATTAPAFANGSADLVPLAHTGAPAEQLCTRCHTSVTNARAGRVEVLFGALLRYTPGVRQQFRVRVFSGLTNHGFQISARLADNSQAGTFAAVATGNTTVRSMNGIDYVMQTEPGLGEGATFTFEWTPPSANAGDIRFHLSAVGGNGDGLASDLDSVYSATYSLAPSTAVEPGGFRLTSFRAFNSVTKPFGISNDGRITGVYGSNPQRAFIRNADGSIVNFDIAGANNIWSYGINSSGAVAGAYDAPGETRRRGFVRAADGTVTTFDVPGALETVLSDINDQGRAAGYFLDSSSRYHGVLLEPNGSFQIIDAPGTVATRLFGISASGFVSGVVRVTALGADETFLSTPVYSTYYPGTCAVNRSSISDTGEFAGGCNYRTAGGRDIFLDRMFAAASFSGINNSGTIAGYSGDDGAILTSCTGTLESTTANALATGSTGHITLTGPADCRYVFASEAPWILVSNDGSYTAQPNTSTAPRTGVVRAAGQAFTIAQGGITCTIQLTGGAPVAGWPGGDFVLNVSAPEGCGWTPTVNVPWITITTFSPNPGAGLGTISYNLQANPTSFARTGTITVGGVVFVINQAGGPGCFYSVSPVSFAFGNGAATGSIVVTTQTGCPWTAVSNSNWITITSGASSSGNSTASFSVAPNTTPGARNGSIAIAGLTVTVTQQAGVADSLRFVPVAPCRAADTRPEGGKSGQFGPPRLSAGTSRDIPLTLSGCGIPNTARAYSVNITVVPPGFLGFVSVWPAGSARPLVSTLNSWNGRVVANAAIVPAGTNGAISLFASDDTEVIVDVNGYFVPASQPEGLAFYPVTPCRVADTRGGPGFTGQFGGPAIGAGSTRNVNVLAGACGIPSTARAFSFNVTAAPPAYLGYLTIWPGGQFQPLVSTLNSWDGTVVANAAIVPAGADGSVNVFASNDTDVILDINGYFAPPGGNGALNFFTATPCRAVDTRPDGGKSGLFGAPALVGGTTRLIPMAESSCGLPSSARAYSLNVTVVPPGYLGFLTTWPAGLTIPVASTLNSWNGQVVANAALVPAGSTGAINVFASNPTDVIIDVNGYFAP